MQQRYGFSSTTSPLTMKITRSAILVVRSAMRSKLWAHEHQINRALGGGRVAVNDAEQIGADMRDQRIDLIVGFGQAVRGFGIAIDIRIKRVA